MVLLLPWSRKTPRYYTGLMSRRLGAMLIIGILLESLEARMAATVKSEVSYGTLLIPFRKLLKEIVVTGYWNGYLRSSTRMLITAQQRPLFSAPGSGCFNIAP